MQKQDDVLNTDLGTFLFELGKQIKKEGSALQALAKINLESGDFFDTFRQAGIDIKLLGEQLLAVKNQLCTKCEMKPVSITLNFSSDDNNKEVKKSNSGKEKKI